MAKKNDTQPDMKQLEKRVKDANSIGKKLAQCKEKVTRLAATVKELDKKVS
jgi:hypothetical protein